MHSIERYGIVALLFLVVTVVAVLMWDGDQGKKPASGSAALYTATPERSVTSGDEPDAGRRLGLVADRQPGPLQRNPRGRARPNRTEVEPTGVPEPSALSAGSQDELLEEAAPEATLESPRERPAPEQVIGQADPEPEPASSAPRSVPTTPAVPVTHAYTVRSGDTLSEIAQRELGSSRRWQELVAVNPGLDPAKLRVGKTIQIPGAKDGAAVARASETKSVAPAASPKGAASAQPPAAAGGKTWKVGKGENLWRIAERALGDGKRWGEIARLNPKVDPDKLLLGQVLVLPGSATTASGAPKTSKSGAKVASVPPKTPRTKAGANEAPVLVASATSERAARRGGKVK